MALLAPSLGLLGFLSRFDVIYDMWRSSRNMSFMPDVPPVDALSLSLYSSCTPKEVGDGTTRRTQRGLFMLSPSMYM